ncbi:divalent-cation tolerance protein CutA [Candidatus Woesearchaeota archaeon]|nr:divalent-cation tolerance protein CutA [Candidatus Woesearchaeota archaeon]
MGFIIVYITHQDREKAETVAKHLLNRRLVACANIFPITSIYPWEGEVKRADEFVTLVKTVPERWEELKAEVENIHPYDMPCIMRLDASANDAYERWIQKETRKG